MVRHIVGLSVEDMNTVMVLNKLNRDMFKFNRDMFTPPLKVEIWTFFTQILSRKEWIKLYVNLWQMTDNYYSSA